MKEIFLSVIIPCYDEMGNLQKGVLDKVTQFFEQKKYSYEIIVVDDGSKDGSEKFIKQFSEKHPTVSLLKNDHQGKAGAVSAGMLKARGKYALFTDMDQATPIEEVDRLLPFFDKGYAIVIGSRQGRKGAPWTRKLMAKSMMMLRTYIVGLAKLNDTQCGFKIFTHESSQLLFSRMNTLHHGFKHISGSNVTAGFDVELLYLAQTMGYKIKEVPVQWRYVETRRVSPLKDSIEGLRSLVEIKVNQMKGRY